MSLLFLRIKPEVQKNDYMHVKETCEAEEGSTLDRTDFPVPGISSSFLGDVCMHTCTAINTYGQVRKHYVLNIP